MGPIARFGLGTFFFSEVGRGELSCSCGREGTTNFLVRSTGHFHLRSDVGEPLAPSHTQAAVIYIVARPLKKSVRVSVCASLRTFVNGLRPINPATSRATSGRECVRMRAGQSGFIVMVAHRA